MNIKKILFIQIFIFHSITQPYNLENKDIKKIATHGIIATTVCALTYLWATSGDTVEQRIKDAQADLETMSEYDQQFDTSMIFGEQESQIKTNLNQLHIDINNLSKNFNQKLSDDLITIQKTYNNLWIKSFYGGKEIAELTRHVYQIKTKIKNLLEYLQKHQHFIQGHQIIQDSTKLLNRNVLSNTDELIKTATLYNSESNFPLYTYIKKIQHDLACIALLTTEKNDDYPELSTMITEYESILLEIKNTITSTDLYKTQILSKLEYDIAQLTELYQKLELQIKKLELDIAIAKMK